jgi:hypothetical protein
MTPLTGARNDKCLASGDSLGERWSGFPNSALLGMRDMFKELSEVVKDKFSSA